ncbi:hypothetical protein N656DRAFT_219790 [Canariomyces notabilis]|uniref:Uncharacterized protein n=1 Tax=Canariomyces notabilis TaxID=2074819 RepID=A0AAN6TK73_9PEZI|nr:hypothetical protein N656DRAFT_219790 [Canariomyces arenarius]
MDPQWEFETNWQLQIFLLLLLFHVIPTGSTPASPALVFRSKDGQYRISIPATIEHRHNPLKPPFDILCTEYLSHIMIDDGTWRLHTFHPEQLFP